jgi:hypothetical protein
VSAGKTLPEWLAEKRANLKKDVDFQTRIELIQDCAFPTASAKVQFTRDQRFLVGVGEQNRLGARAASRWRNEREFSFAEQELTNQEYEFGN